MIDITDLIFKSGISLAELSELVVCSSLDDYRNQIGIIGSTIGIVESNTSDDYLSIPVNLKFVSNVVMHNNNEETQNNNNINNDPCNMMQNEDTDDNDFCGDAYDDAPAEDYDMNENQTQNQINNPLPTDEKNNSFTRSPKLKINWNNDALNSSTTANTIQIAELKTNHSNEVNQNATENITNTVASLVGIDNIVEDNEYTFFDLQAMTKCNAWAGARHWKYATRTVAKAEAASENKKAEKNQTNEEDGNGSDDNITNEVVKTKTKTSKKKKELEQIEFSMELADESLFKLSKKNDTTLLTNAAIEKTTLEAESNVLFLPSDAKLEVKDLCRLFLAPHVVVPPPNSLKQTVISSFMHNNNNNNNSTNSNNLLKNFTSNISYKTLLCDRGDRMWNETVKNNNNELKNNSNFFQNLQQQNNINNNLNINNLSFDNKMELPVNSIFNNNLNNNSNNNDNNPLFENNDHNNEQKFDDNYDNNNDDGCNNDNDDYDDNFASQKNNEGDVNNYVNNDVVEEKGLFINQNLLLQAKRTVQKIDIELVTFLYIAFIYCILYFKNNVLIILLLQISVFSN
jgi:hypothetical protein